MNPALAATPSTNLLPLTLADRAMARLSAAARTGFYVSTASALWRMALPRSKADKNARNQLIREAYDLHVRVLERPGMRGVMARSEREDWATLPFFVASVPGDLRRVLGKRKSRLRALPVTAPDRFPYPDYYLYDFHNQANGNLSMRAALTYEWQIRFLFTGTNRLMRQGVIDEIPAGDDLEVLDVGCGTAAWMTQAYLQGRHHRFTGIDLSKPYLRVARAFRGRLATFQQMAAEQLDPSWSNRFDVVTTIWLFHEMPPAAVDKATAEMARVLKPGGKLVFMEAIQAHDGPIKPPEDRKQGFGELFNEPWFDDYQRMDLQSHFARHGLRLEKSTKWFHSKVLTLVKDA